MTVKPSGLPSEILQTTCGFSETKDLITLREAGLIHHSANKILMNRIGYRCINNKNFKELFQNEYLKILIDLRLESTTGDISRESANDKADITSAISKIFHCMLKAFKITQKYIVKN